MTVNGTDDGSQLEPLLEQVDTDIEDVCADGAYDKVGCWDGLMERNINPIIPSRRNAVLWYLDEEDDMKDYPRIRAYRKWIRWDEKNGR